MTIIYKLYFRYSSTAKDNKSSKGKDAKFVSIAKALAEEIEKGRISIVYPKKDEAKKPSGSPKKDDSKKSNRSPKKDESKKPNGSPNKDYKKPNVTPKKDEKGKKNGKLGKN